MASVSGKFKCMFNVRDFRTPSVECELTLEADKTQFLVGEVAPVKVSGSYFSGPERMHLECVVDACHICESGGMCPPTHKG